MKFLRHILSHMMFIILLVGIFSVYYFRNQVLPENYVSKINVYAEKIHPYLVTIASPVIVKKELLYSEKNTQPQIIPVTVEPVPVADKKLPVEVAANQELEVVETKSVAIKVVEIKPLEGKTMEVGSVASDSVEQKVIIPLLVKTKEKKNESGDVASDEKSKVTKTAEITKEININKEIIAKEKPLIKEDEVTPKEKLLVVSEAPISSDEEAASYKVILHAARTAFLKSQYKIAIEKYKELIDLEEHEADFYGELGNVYYSVGNWNLAGEAYYEAAQRLIERGDMKQVFYLQRVLQGLDAERASKLAQKMTRLRQTKVLAR